MDSEQPYEVIWDDLESEDLYSIFQYISRDHPLNAARVVFTIYDLAASLSKLPQRFPSERKFKKFGNVRSFLKWKYRVYYEIKENRVIILYIYHTAQHPGKVGKRFSSIRKNRINEDD